MKFGEEMMLDAVNISISELFSNVLDESIRSYSVTSSDVRSAIENMNEVYRPNDWRTSPIVNVANYNDPAHRIAYLHRYAALHTSLVCEILGRSLKNDRDVLVRLVTNSEELKVCSIGGGPGPDVVALLYVLTSVFGVRRSSMTLVDCMIDWKITFDSIIDELRTGRYGVFLSQAVSPVCFTSRYIYSDMLGPMQNDVNNAIATSNLVTMVKFISASACQDSHIMIKKILNSMRAGALLLFIDNAGGGYHELVGSIARKLQFKSVYGPLHHELYENALFSVKRFNYTSLSKTRVAVEIWKKPSSPNRSFSNPPKAQNKGANPANYPKPKNTNMSSNFKPNNIQVDTVSNSNIKNSILPSGGTIDPSRQSKNYTVPPLEFWKSDIETPSYNNYQWCPVGGTSSSQSVPLASNRSISSSTPVTNVAAIVSKTNNSAGSVRNDISQFQNNNFERSHSPPSSSTCDRSATSAKQNDHIQDDDCCSCCTIS